MLPSGLLLSLTVAKLWALGDSAVALLLPLPWQHSVRGDGVWFLALPLQRQARNQRGDFLTLKIWSHLIILSWDEIALSLLSLSKFQNKVLSSIHSNRYKKGIELFILDGRCMPVQMWKLGNLRDVCAHIYAVWCYVR